MDIFIEQMVKKKREVKDYLVILASILAVFAVIFILPLSFVVPMMGLLIFAVCVVSLYLIYFLVTSINKEFEYSFTNGILDVDKIINMRKRKSMVEINVRKMEWMGNRQDKQFRDGMENRNLKKISACSHKDAEDLCFIIFQDKTGQYKMLLFNPNDEFKNAIKRYNPQKVGF